MSWSGEVVTIVRHLIGDVDSGNYTYSDDRLVRAGFVSAQLVQLEVTTTNDYAIDIENLTISPDPTTPTRDTGFINLVALKTTANILFAEAKLAAGNGISITDGPSSVSTLGQGANVARQAQSIADKYEIYKNIYIAGRYVKFVSTPITTDNVSEFFDQF